MALTSTQINRLLNLIGERWYDIDLPPSEEWRQFDQWVEEIETPLELHCLAANTNWDWMIHPLNAVVTHSLCDRASAHLIYWSGDPNYALQPIDSPLWQSLGGKPSDWDQEIIELLHLIEERSGTRQYRYSSIAFDPRDLSGENRLDNLKHDTRFELSPPPIPTFMCEPLVGVDATILAELINMLVAVDWYQQGGITPAELLPCLDWFPALRNRLASDIPNALVAMANRLRGDPNSGHDQLIIDSMQAFLIQKIQEQP